MIKDRWNFYKRRLRVFNERRSLGYSMKEDLCVLPFLINYEIFWCSLTEEKIVWSSPTEERSFCSLVKKMLAFLWKNKTFDLLREKGNLVFSKIRILSSLTEEDLAFSNRRLPGLILLKTLFGSTMKEEFLVLYYKRDDILVFSYKKNICGLDLLLKRRVSEERYSVLLWRKTLWSSINEDILIISIDDYLVLS